ncbi:MAG: class I SAM-dependent methyltransferase [Cyanobacteria bacterium J149]|nr:MAG: class I SAM-dependent methyltransferase [Cyanobacteria bacterium J149]
MANKKALNIGCGPKSRWIPNTDGVDIIDFGQKYIGDFLKIDIPEKYDIIYAHHVIEHIPDTIKFMDKVGEVLKGGGILDIRVPQYPHPQAFQDPTHVKFIPSAVFFLYFTDKSPAGHCYSKHKFSLVGYNNDRYNWELHVVLKKEAL